jgi:cytochrome bd-type quinol oxidase subunit 2
MPELFRVVVLIAFAAIVVSLGSALYHLSRGTQKDSAKMARALTIRIALSIALFALIMLAWYAGLISPHSVVPSRAQQVSHSQ